MKDTAEDRSPAGADDTWLTYAELAAIRGIDRASAFKLALRHRWRRQKNNQGQVMVLVPQAWSDQSHDGSDDVSRHIAAFEASLAAVREAHAGELAAVREQLTEARRAIKSAEARLAAAESHAAERQAELRERVAAAERRADQAEAFAARAWWRRLRRPRGESG